MPFRSGPALQYLGTSENTDFDSASSATNISGRECSRRGYKNLRPEHHGRADHEQPRTEIEAHWVLGQET